MMNSEKDMFIDMWNREFQTTLKVLKAFPENEQELRPHAKSKSARELAWGFVAEERTGFSGVLAGKIDFQSMPKPPMHLKDIVSEFEKWHKETQKTFEKVSIDELNKHMDFFTAPKKMEPVRKMDLLWMFLMDQIHHRGQFSVYLRMAGGKVPSIYGPTADEPWM
jgi:uncharacterized damage-inducible protein DinB